MNGPPKSGLRFDRAQMSESIEIIDAPELAKRWMIPESWVRDHTRSRTNDPIPHIQFGRYVRFRWGSSELAEWVKNHSTQ